MYEYNFCPVCGSILKEGYIEGHLREHCSDCNFVYYKNPKPSAGAIAIQKDEILLVKRGVEPGKGSWAPPSGFIDPGESAEEACLRELKEETGLQGEISELLGVYTEKAHVYGSVMVVMFLVKNLTGDLKAADDAEKAKFVSISNVKEFAFNSFNKALARAKEIL